MGWGGGGGQAPATPRAPGVYSVLECRVQDYHCALVGCGAALEADGANAVCFGCLSVVYCDEECQTAHLEAHMEECFVTVAERVCSRNAHQVDEGGEYVLRTMLCKCREEYGTNHMRTMQSMDFLGRLMSQQGRCLGSAWRPSALRLAPSIAAHFPAWKS